MLKTLSVVAVVALALVGFNGACLADPQGGMLIKADNVKANQTDIWTFTLRGNEVTRIRLSGDGDTGLELRVYDEFGNLVASDTYGYGDDREVRVKPRWTGVFKVKIRNLGGISNNYVLVLD